MITYRDYQEEDAAKTLEALRLARRVLLVEPTGAGKSIVLGKIITDARSQGFTRALVMVHKLDLIDQLAEDLARLPATTLVVEQAEQTGLGRRDWNVAVASIDTLLARPDVLRPLEGDERLLVVIDETHRAAADGYRRVLEQLGCFAGADEAGPRLVGMTATAFRGDGEDLSSIFETTAMVRDLRWGMREGWLVPVKAHRVSIEQIEEVGRETSTRRPATAEEREASFLKTFFAEVVRREGTARRAAELRWPTLVMAPSVAEGRRYAEALRRRHVRAAMVDSLMDQAERRAATQAFREGALDVLVSFNVITEGFNAPHAACLMMVRATESPVTYVQALGRVLRPVVGDSAAYNASREAGARRAMIAQSAKPYAYVYDFSDFSDKYNLAALFGLSPQFDFEGEDVLTTVEALEEAAGAYGIDKTAVASARAIGHVVEDVELWREATRPNVDVPEEVRLVYAKTGESTWRITFPEGDRRWTIVLRRDARGAYIATIEQPFLYKEAYWNGSEVAYKRYSGEHAPDLSERRFGRLRYELVSGMHPELLTTAQTKLELFQKVEYWIWLYHRDAFRLLSRDARWREKEPTDEQKKLLRQMQRKHIALPPEITRGTATFLLDQYFAGLLKPRPKNRRRLGARRPAVL